mgnify:CR=1 FL=1
MQPDTRTVLVHLIERLCQKVRRISNNKRMKNNRNRKGTTCLVFLPGIASILEVEDEMYQSKFVRFMDIHMLHSTCSIEEQKEVVAPANPGRLKVILTTNIAESSLTVPDVSVIIDSCLCRQIRWNSELRMEILGDAWISHEAADQRKGRAGRVRPGEVYRMVPRNFYQTEMMQSIEPEIKRCPLEETILRIIDLPGANDPLEVLKNCIDCPELTHVHEAVRILEDLEVIKMDSTSTSTQRILGLTTLGVLAVKLPIPLRLGLFLVYAHCFGVIEEAIVAAAILARKTPLLRVMSKPMQSHQAAMRFSGGFMSDIIASINAYHFWEQEREKRSTGGEQSDSSSEMEWCKEHLFLSLFWLREVDDFVFFILL